MMEETKWFLLDLPPINLYTANLLQPYFNGVEEMRVYGIKQPTLLHTNKIDTKAQHLVDSHNAVKKCKQLCKLDKSSNTCIGCGRSIEEIIEAGLKRKETK